MIVAAFFYFAPPCLGAAPSRAMTEAGPDYVVLCPFFATAYPLPDKPGHPLVGNGDGYVALLLRPARRG